MGAELPPYIWLYLGHDFVLGRRWERELGKDFRRLDLGRLIDEHAAQLREPFNAWIDALSADHVAEPAWWFTRMSERNPLSSSLFLFVCYLSVVKALFRQGERPALMVIESAGLLCAIEILARELGSGTKRLSFVTWRTPAQRWFAVARAAIAFALWGLRNKMAALRTWQVAPRPTFVPGKRTVILSTYFHDTQLHPDHVFRDRYLPRLAAWLADQHKEVWIWPTMVGKTRSRIEVFRWMRQSTANFLIPHDWLSFRDYMFAFRVGLRALRCPHQPRALTDLDVSPLVVDQRTSPGTFTAAAEAALLSRIPVRLLAAGLKPERLIGWWENQLFDKARVIGWREAFPDVPYIAVQNAPLYPNLLSMFPTPGECDANVVPDRVVCSGPLPARVLAERTGGKLRTGVGCGLRYSYLHSRRRTTDTRPVEDIIEVLITLPYSPSGAANLLVLLEPVMRRHTEYAWRLRPHPDYDFAAVVKVLGGPPNSNWSVVDGSLEEWLGKVRLVITTASGTAIESLACGVPTLMVGSTTELTLNPLELSTGFSPVVYSSQEIESELERLAVPNKRQELIRQGRELLNGWFNPVTEEALRAFLE